MRAACIVEIPANADFVIEGYVDPRKPLRGEGPFGDDTGYYTLPEPYAVFHVQGSTINVELNGTMILDADLSKVTEYMANSAHPGKDRKSGHFGFAGHNDPVAFRSIRIKKL